MELGKSVVADELSRLVARGHEGLLSGSRGVETIGVRVGSSFSVAGCHFD